MVVRGLFVFPPKEGQLLMKKFVLPALLVVSLCIAGCSGEKQVTKVQSGGNATSTTIEKK
jgi:outer membrane murein-binding lipoprotein Lpp